MVIHLGAIVVVPGCACVGILANSDGNRVSNKDEECIIVAEDAQWGW
jgi:hypothetical protein